MKDIEIINNNQYEEKTITLKKNEFIFDLNSLFLPFIPDYDAKNNLIKELEVEIDTDSFVKVSSHVHGVPTLYDKDVLLALQRIMIKQNSDLQNNFMVKSNFTEEERTVKPISIEDIAREMGYENVPSVNTKLKICRSIERMHDATYVSTKNRTYVKKHDTYLMHAREGIHLIDNFRIIEFSKDEKLRRMKNSPKEASNKDYVEKKKQLFDGYIQLVINSTTFKSIILDQYVFYNWKEAQDIKNLTARHIYLLGLKIAGKQKECKMSLQTILKYIPTKPGMLPKYQKQTIKLALNKLSDSGKCSISYMKNDVYHFSYSKSKKKKVIKNNYMKDKFNSFGDMIDGFINLGLTREEAVELDLQKISYYQALLRYVTIIASYGEIANTRQYILRCIENEKVVPEEYYS